MTDASGSEGLRFAGSRKRQRTDEKRLESRKINGQSDSPEGQRAVGKRDEGLLLIGSDGYQRMSVVSGRESKECGQVCEQCWRNDIP